jgi:hypothetical protein
LLILRPLVGEENLEKKKTLEMAIEMYENRVVQLELLAAEEEMKVMIFKYGRIFAPGTCACIRCHGS